MFIKHILILILNKITPIKESIIRVEVFLGII